MNEFFTISLSVNSVAWYGTIVATLSFGFSAYQIWRDSSRLSIVIEKNLNFFNSESLYKENIDYIGVIVTNKGRRAIRVDQARLVTFYEKNQLLLWDSFVDHRNKILTEKNPKTQFFIESSEVDFDKIKCAVIVDGTGKKHKKYTKLLPTFSEYYFVLKNKLNYLKNNKSSI